MAVYYIASASSGGSTGNTGLSAASPWPLSKLNTFEVADDLILINKGDSFTNTITISRSGTSGHPITYDIYGSSTNNPIIDGGASTTNKTLNITGAFVVVNNLTIQNSFVFASGTLFISGTHDVTINHCHINLGFRGIHPRNCTGNIVITNNYIEGIGHTNNNVGPSNGDGSCIQPDTCTGAGQVISGNKIYIVSNIGAGDLISLFTSSGTISSYIQVINNIMFGGGLGTAGYCGIGVGDQGGQYQNVDGNLISTSGYAGIQIAGGDSHTINNNKIYSPQVTFPGGTGSLKALSVISAGFVSTNITAGNNKLNWKDYNGNVNNLFVAPGQTTPTNWSTNTANSVQDPLAPSTIVANPPFVSGDWNVTVIPVFNYTPSINVFVVGTIIGNLTPNVTSQYYPITSYSISPSLPAGLSFNTTTGVISGTPTATSANTSYTITATNIGGTNTSLVSIQVNSSPGVILRRNVILI